MVIIDGKEYESADDAPDLGSWVGSYIDLSKNKKREYYGLSSDYDKLPKYDDLESGSYAYCMDDGTVYMYDAKSKQWLEQ